MFEHACLTWDMGVSVPFLLAILGVFAILAVD
jgi:hypothetical protein